MPPAGRSHMDSADDQPELIFRNIAPTCFASRNIPIDLVERFVQHGGENSTGPIQCPQASSSTHPSQPPDPSLFSLYLVLPTDHDDILRLLSSRPLVLYDVQWVDDSIEEGEVLDLGDYVIDAIAILESNRKKRIASRPEHSVSMTSRQSRTRADVDVSERNVAPPAQKTKQDAATSKAGSPNIKRERSESSESGERGEDQDEDEDEDEDEHEDEGEDEREAHFNRSHFNRSQHSSPAALSVIDDSPLSSPPRSGSPDSSQTPSSGGRRGTTPYPHWRTRQFFPRPEVHSAYKREPTPPGMIREPRTSSIAPTRSMIGTNGLQTRDSERSPKRIKMEDTSRTKTGSRVEIKFRLGPSQLDVGSTHGDHYSESPSTGQDDPHEDEEDDELPEDHIATPNVKVEITDDIKNEVASLAPTWKDDESEISEEEIEPIELTPFEIMRLQAMRDARSEVENSESH